MFILPLPTTKQLRVALYLIQIASDDEETQKQGMVLIFMLLKDLTSVIGNTSTATATADVHTPTTRWKTMASVLNRIFQCAPVRVGAIHVCTPSGYDMEVAKSDLVNEFGQHERLRCRFHTGTSMELSMSLNKYGIPTDRLPLKYDGSIKTEDHLQWIAVREAKEDAFRQGRDFDVVECPMNMDILAGRGQLVRNHPGNVSFRTDFIQARSNQYNAAHTRDEKNDIANVILDDIANMARRFLKQHPSGYWTELERKVAKEKVMMAFREYRKSQKLEESRASTPNMNIAAAAAVTSSSPPPVPYQQQHQHHQQQPPSHPQQSLSPHQLSPQPPQHQQHMIHQYPIHHLQQQQHQQRHDVMIHGNHPSIYSHHHHHHHHQFHHHHPSPSAAFATSPTASSQAQTAEYHHHDGFKNNSPDDSSGRRSPKRFKSL